MNVWTTKSQLFPGNIGNRNLHYSQNPGNTGCMMLVYLFSKWRAPENDTELSKSRAEISHMGPILLQKLKLFKVLIHGGGSGGRSGEKQISTPIRGL